MTRTTPLEAFEVGMQFRSQQERDYAHTIQGKDELLIKLSNEEDLLDELAALFLFYDGSHEAEVYEPMVPSELACAVPGIELQIRQRVWDFVERFRQQGLITASRHDHNNKTDYRVLTGKGKVALRDGSYRHLVFGPHYTLGKSWHSIMLLALETGESGTAVHIEGDLFLTCAHCAPDDSQITLYPRTSVGSNTEESGHPAEVIRLDRELDLALLRCPHIARADGLRLSKVPPKILDEVLVLHYPNVPAVQQTLIATRGEVNAITQNRFRKGKDLLLSTRTAPGSSGGAVILATGFLGGLIVGSGSMVEGTADSPDSSTWLAEPFFHAIPSDDIGAFLARLDNGPESR